MLTRLVVIVTGGSCQGTQCHSGDIGTESCLQPYLVRLRVNSCLYHVLMGEGKGEWRTSKTSENDVGS